MLTHITAINSFLLEEAKAKFNHDILYILSVLSEFFTRIAE